VWYAQKAFLRIDEAASSGRLRPLDAPLAEFLGKHDPEKISLEIQKTRGDANVSAQRN
jgi:hypothetical protein